MDLLKQGSEPLFPKILWNRPVGTSRAGRLLLIGGHSQEFNAIQSVYAAAQAAEVGKCTVVLPDKLARLLPPEGDFTFVPSTSSGSIAKAATAEILRLAEDADAIGLGASLSNNSETAAVAESILEKSERPTVLYDEVFGLMKFRPQLMAGENRLIVATMPELFKLAGYLKIGISIREPSLVGKIHIIKMLATVTKSQLLVFGPELIVAAEDQVSVTPWKPVPATVIFGITSVIWLQNPTKQFEALTTAAYLIAKASHEVPAEKTSQPVLIQSINKSLRAATDQF